MIGTYAILLNDGDVRVKQQDPSNIVNFSGALKFGQVAFEWRLVLTVCASKSRGRKSQLEGTSLGR